MSFPDYYSGVIFVEAFIDTPNCPQHPVTLVAIGAHYEKAHRALQARGIKTVLLSADHRLADPVAAHVDMLFVHLGAGEAICSMSSNLNTLTEVGFSAELGESPDAYYPVDALYNLLVLGDYVFCNPASSSSKALSSLQEQGRVIIPVKQGYTKCSCAVISKQAIITSDQGICIAARNHNIDTLHIRSGYIKLPGYDYGFIGGCCGLIDKDKLAVCGDIDLHPDGAKIRAFCKSHGVEVVTLYDGILEDIGSIIPLKQAQNPL